MSNSTSVFERIVFPNGLRVLLYPIPHVQSVLMRLDIKGGSVFENKNNNGISHLIEHWVHQGNTRYKNAKMFGIALEEMGIYQNAATHAYGSYYYMKMPSIKTNTALKIFYSLTAQPLFPEDRLSHVKEIVIHEYNDYWQQPENIFSYELLKKRFIDTPSYIQDALGMPRTISSLNRNGAIEWFEKFYKASNSILTIAGNFDLEKIKILINNTFGTLPKLDTIPFPFLSTNHYSSFLIYHYFEKREQITFSLSLPSFGWKGKSNKTLQVLHLATSIIGTDRFSRLYQLLREKHNLVYGISCYDSLFPSRGFITIYGSTSKENLFKALRLIKVELQGLKGKGVSKKEVEVGKNIYISSVVFSLETPEGLAQNLINQEFWEQEIWLPERYIEEVKKISKKEIDKMIKKIFNFSKLNIGLFGNLSKEEVEQVKKIWV